MSKLEGRFCLLQNKKKASADDKEAEAIANAIYT
jgi:hypothetical protein